MADVKCPVCGEPWDMDELHDVDGMEFRQAWREFQRIGCEVFGTGHSDSLADPRIGILAELMGDDVDGFAADLEDFGL